MKKYSCYEYEVRQYRDKWEYIIHADDLYQYEDVIIECNEWYDSKEEAELACIAHIDLLENEGE